MAPPPHGPVPRRRAPGAALLAAAGALALAAAATAAAAPAAADPVGGTYRLAGTARVDAGPVLSRTVESRGDAVVRPSGRGGLRVRLAAQGHACELDARLERGGALAFAPGQRCAFAVDDPGARGRVEARLREGRGTLRGGALALELGFELSGHLSLQTGRAVEVLGTTVELPAAWTPDMPVRGLASLAAEGRRDESRAADR